MISSHYKEAHRMTYSETFVSLHPLSQVLHPTGLDND